MATRRPRPKHDLPIPARLVMDNSEDFSFLLREILSEHPMFIYTYFNTPDLFPGAMHEAVLRMNLEVASLLRSRQAQIQQVLRDRKRGADRP